MEKQPDDIPKPNPRNTISLKTAKEWTKRWRTMESSYNAHQDCKAFNIPLKDLKEAILEGAASVRAYIGVEKLKVEGENVYVEKLMIVGVDKNGKDMISSLDGISLDNEGGKIYDFSEPCPSSCDPDSPLNGSN
ncbi:hypothetical protein [Polaribacter sp. IC073]|uniref:hypothetical protein n=1 Tax=Polaribacter sp. IC073 TaxID=2508540 RepID=UPI0011BD4CB1|nr:hypothetical protein [Polaribacter sp. IC073]TXD46302.1 hypothetical protein ES045_14795 [Polaribacter sp. IC073]